MAKMIVNFLKIRIRFFSKIELSKWYSECCGKFQDWLVKPCFRCFATLQTCLT